MLASWTRTRATRIPGTCGCIPCVYNHVALASRAGMFGARGGILLRNPTSTFVYTTIFAAALATYARFKQRRNEQWDFAFEQLREEFGKPDLTEETNHDVAYRRSSVLESLDQLLEKDLDWNHINQVAGMELVEEKVFEEIQFETESNAEFMPGSFWSLLPYDNRLPNSRIPTPPWPENTGPDLNRHFLPPQSLWASDSMRWKSIRTRLSWKKLTLQELSIGILILKLLRYTEAYKLPSKAFESLSPEIKNIALLTNSDNMATQDYLWKGVKIIRGVAVLSSDEAIAYAKRKIRSSSIPSYSQDSDGDFYKMIGQMNKAIENLLKEPLEDPGNGDGQGDGDGDRLIITKLCHNLFVSPAAPDLQTFNLMLIGFKRRGLHDLVEYVIEAFDVCKIRPNEISCAAILDHYAQTDQPDKFSYFFARMRGIEDALMLARPDIRITEASQSRLIRISKTKVYQKVYPTPVVFKAIMSGVLKFAGFDRAIDIYFELNKDGWGLDVIGLSEFLADCVERKDWEGGLIIWQEITSINQPVLPSHMADAYAYMLGLCSITRNTIAFNQLLNEVARRGFNRKTVMASALNIARKAQAKSTDIAPAWAADNLLIAVSEFMNENEDFDSNVEDSVFESAFERDAAVQSEEIHDNDEAWALWMSHELGELEPVKDEDDGPGVKS